jgi:hypothetical protein
MLDGVADEVVAEPNLHESLTTLEQGDVAFPARAGHLGVIVQPYEDLNQSIACSRLVRRSARKIGKELWAVILLERGTLHCRTRLQGTGRQDG